MGVEIERKFLVCDVDYFRAEQIQTNYPKLQIKQGYLSLEPQVRVRTVHESINNEHHRYRAYLTVKGKTEHISTPEFEFEIPYADGVELLGLCQGGVVIKDRLEVGRWEVDFFKGNNLGLVIAEIELQSEDEVVFTPFWVGQEVTNDSKYSNKNLSRAPFNTWKGYLDLLG
jgi:CYTH domain-containing protein